MNVRAKVQLQMIQVDQLSTCDDADANMMKTAPVRDMGGSSIDEGRDDVAQGGEGQVDLCRL